MKDESRKFEEKIDSILGSISVGGEKLGRKINRKGITLWLIFWFVIVILGFGIVKLVYNFFKGLSGQKHYKNLKTIPNESDEEIVTGI